jgi:hypothetical protein
VDKLTHLLEWILEPLLTALDRTGLFHTARFAPLYRYAAAVSAVVLSGYVLSLLLTPVEKRLHGLRRVRIIGRVVAIGVAAAITYGIFGDAHFILARDGTSAAVVRTNLGFLLTLGLLVFLEVRLSRRKRE